MNLKIRKMNEDDRAEVLSMMEEFYSSDAVFTCGSKEIFNIDISTCIKENPYLDGFIFCDKERILGYAMVAKSFSTEFAKPCIWLEDLYLKPDFRGKGIIPKFFSYIKSLHPDSIFRLEAEKENSHACYVYKKLGFVELPYSEFKLEN